VYGLSGRLSSGLLSLASNQVSDSMGNASKDDIMLCMAVFSRLLRGVWDGGTRAYGDITGTRAETVQVVGIKAMGDCKMK
jgi:hypothetical protein